VTDRPAYWLRLLRAGLSVNDSSTIDRLNAALGERYQLDRELGRGAFAAVFLARDLRHRRQVAIKVLYPHVARLIGAGRFLREIETIAGLQHPHILPLHDSGEVDGLLFFVAPFVAGGTLRDRLEREGPLALDEVLRLTGEVADALSFAHARGVVHRDIKPENILLASGHALVADFGIAKVPVTAGAERLTETGMVIGTPRYMSPEQALADAAVDPRTDLYALASVCHEMLTGVPGRAGGTSDGHPSSDRRLPAGLARELSRALSIRPEDRHATVAEFVAALRRAVDRSRTAWRLLAPVAGVAAIAAVAALLMLRGRAANAGSGGRLSLAVFPFRASDDAARSLVEIVPDLLATALDGTPRVRIADPWALWQGLRPARDAPATNPDPGAAERLARRAGATRYVLGALSEQGTRLDVILRVYSAGAAQPLATLTEAGHADSLLPLVQRLAARVIAAVWDRGPRPEVPDLTAYTTSSGEALKAYLQAKEAMRRGLIDSSETAISRAVELDSNFALALVETVRVRGWATYLQGRTYSGREDLLFRADSLSRGLSERNRLMVRASLMMVATNGREAAAALNRMIELDSTDLAAWDLLSYSHLVHGWQYGASIEDAIGAEQRSYALDSTWAPTLLRGVSSAVALHDTMRIRRIAAALAQSDTASPAIRGSLTGARAVLMDDATFERWVTRMTVGSPTEWLTILRLLRPNRPDRAAEFVAQSARSPAVPPPMRVGAAAQLAAATGNFVEVERANDDARWAAFPDLHRRLRLMCITAALAGVGDSAVAARATAELEAEARDSATDLMWAVGAFHAALGDRTAAARWRARIGAYRGLPDTRSPPEALQADIDARLSARAGNLAAALQLARRAHELHGYHSNLALETTPEAATRFLLALLLVQADELARAEPLFRSFAPPTTWAGYYTARARYELGAMAERRGEPTEALGYYQGALDLWRQGGNTTARWRTAARAAVERLAPSR
jgi:serine/threonine protein kinase